VISVIVPAHDEARVIERSLRALCGGAGPGELEVLVVCNGSSDDTAERARTVPGPIQVIESPVASKTDALNRGDAAARGFPRLYVDADIVLPFRDLQEVTRVLETGEALAAAPRAEIDLGGASAAVRSFYRVWTSLPYFDASMIGAGVYGLSEAGRRRFDRFPEIIADDEFVRRQFAPSERRRVDACSFTIVAPSRLSGVVAIKTRSRLGRLQLERNHPELPGGGGVAGPGTLATVLSRPALWPHVPAYLWVVLVSRRRARRRFAASEFGIWDRDDSSRSGEAS
jgi:glycosyltransferase involved in cell wall biosynthesis